MFLCMRDLLQSLGYSFWIELTCGYSLAVPNGLDLYVREWVDGEPEAPLDRWYVLKSEYLSPEPYEWRMFMHWSFVGLRESMTD